MSGGFRSKVKENKIVLEDKTTSNLIKLFI